LDDAIVLQRATALLAPPHTATFAVKNGVLQVSGSARAAWVKELQAKAPLVPGIRSLELSPGLDPERLVFNQAKSEIEATLVMLRLASATLSSSEQGALRRLAEQVQALLKAADGLHENVTFAVHGHTDSTGAEVSNQNLSERRAERVVRELTQLGVPE